MNENVVVSLSLDVNEVNSILAVLGDLPTKSNAYPLMVKILAQADPQVPKQEQQEAEQQKAE